MTGVLVGHCTLVHGSGALVRGSGPVRTGVTVVPPAVDGIWSRSLFAGCHRLNGNGEVTGLEWLRESGLTSPIGLTNSPSVGVVRGALVAVEVEQREANELFWALPVVGETWDGVLNDINGFHVKDAHVRAAVAAHRDGFVLNAERRPKPSYLVLHHANCPKITRLQRGASRWTGDYIKFCGHRAELETLARHEIGGELRCCGICGR